MELDVSREATIEFAVASRLLLILVKRGVDDSGLEEVPEELSFNIER